MDILEVTSRFPPAIGGVEKSAYEIAKRIRAMGDKIEVWCSDAYTLRPLRQFLATRSEMDGLVVIRKKSFFPRLVPSVIGPIAPGQFLDLSTNEKRFDIIHSHGYGFFATYGVAWPSARKKMPLIISAHTAVESTLPRFVYDQSIGKYLVKMASAIICDTVAERDFFLRLGANREKLLVIPNGVDFEEFRNLQNRKLFLDRFPIQSSFILFVGRLTDGKGVSNLIRVFKQLKETTKNDWKLVVVGEDHGSGPALMKLSKDLDMANDVVFTGRLNDREVIGAFQACEMLVLPSLRGESQGIVILESMAAGKPVVASRIGGIAKTVIEGRNGLLFDPLDLTEMKTQILTLIEDESLRQRIGMHNSTCAKDYSLDVIAKKTRELYEQVANSSQAR